MSTVSTTILRPQPFAIADIHRGLASIALFIVTFWFGTNLSSNDQMAKGSVHDWQDVLRIGLLFSCGIWGLFRYRTWLGKVANCPFMWIALLLIWFAMWLPLTAKPHISAVKLAAFASCLTFLPAVTVVLGARQTFFTIWIALLCYCAGAVTAHTLFPSTRDQYDPWRLAGFGQPNTVAFRISVTIILTAVLCRERWLSWLVALPIFGVLFLLLKWTDSRTSLAVTLLILAWFLVRKLPTAVKTLGILCGTVMLGIVTMYCLSTPNWISMDDISVNISHAKNPEELATLHGRSQIWEFLNEKVARSPLWGYGYGSEPAVVIEFIPFGETEPFTASAHSMYYATCIAGGGIALLLLLLGFFHQLLSCIRRPNPFAEAILILLVLNGLTESILFAGVTSLPMHLWILASAWHGVGMTEPNPVTSSNRDLIDRVMA